MNTNQANIQSVASSSTGNCGPNRTMELQLPEEQKVYEAVDLKGTPFTPVEMPDALQYWLQDGLLSHTPTSHLPIHRAVNISLEEVDYPQGFVSHDSQGKETYFPTKPGVERIVCCREPDHYHSHKHHQALSFPSGLNRSEEADGGMCTLQLPPIITEHLGPETMPSAEMEEKIYEMYSKQQPGRLMKDHELQKVIEGRHEMLRRCSPNKAAMAQEKNSLTPVPLRAYSHINESHYSHQQHQHSSVLLSPNSQRKNTSAIASPPPPPQAPWMPLEDEDYLVEDPEHQHIQCHSFSPSTDEDSPLPHCPERPFSLVRTHFSIQLKANACVWDLMQLIHQCLSNFSQYDFSFIEKCALWKGKYIRGSQCCVIYINLYCELNQSNTFIIEVVKVFGDSKPFCEFFREFRGLMTQYQQSNEVETQQQKTAEAIRKGHESIVQRVQSISESPFFWSANNTPSSQSNYSSRFSPDGKWKTSMTREEFLHKIEPICKMESSPFYEVKLEAAKMLADLTHLDPHMLSDDYCMRDIVHILDNLILRSGFAMVKEQAIIALAGFVEVPGYASMILQQSEVIPLLLSFVSNPCDSKKAYETAQLRRECARIIEQLVSFDAKEFKRYLERRNLSLQIWLERIEDIEDLRTKLSAKRTKHILIQKCYPHLKETPYCFSPTRSDSAKNPLSPSSTFPFSPKSKAIK